MLLERSTSQDPFFNQILPQLNREYDYQITLDHVLGNFSPKLDELILGQILGDLVLQAQITENLTRSSTADSMNVLQRVLHPLVVWDFNSSNTHTFDVQPTNLNYTQTQKIN